MERKNKITLKLAALIFVAFSVMAICACIFLTQTLFGNAISNVNITQSTNELTREQQALVSLSTGEKFKYTDIVTNETGETDVLYVACPNCVYINYNISYNEFSNTFYVYGEDNSGGVIDHNYKCEVIDKSHYVASPIVSLDMDMNKYVFSCGNLVTITFDANGGSFKKNGEKITKKGISGTEFRFEDYPTFTDYVFKGYNTKQDGTGSYINFISSLPDESFTLYAQWESADATPSITFDSEDTGPFAVYIYKRDGSWKVVDKAENIKHYDFNIPKDIQSTSSIQYCYEDVANNMSELPEQEVCVHSPFSLRISMGNELNDEYKLYVFAENTEGLFIKNCYHNSTMIKPLAYSTQCQLGGANNFTLSIGQKEDTTFSFATEKNLIMRNTDAFSLQKLEYSIESKLEINLKKEDFIYFTFCPMGRVSEYFSGITDGCIEAEIYIYNSENNIYESGNFFIIFDYVKDISNPLLINKICGMEYAGEICNIQTDWVYIYDGEHNNVNLLTTGGGYSVSSKFDANGGKFSDGDEFKEIDQTTGLNLIFPNEEPTNDELYFDGWYTAPVGGQLINLESYPYDPIDESKPWDPADEGLEANVYYAHWTTTPPGPDPDPDPDPEPIPVVDPVEDIGTIDYMNDTAQTSDGNGLIVFGLLICILGSAVILRKSYTAK